MDSTKSPSDGKAIGRDGYPSRDSFHAQRVIRAMTKTAAAQEISAAGFALVALVACQEDAKRYAAPPTFFNHQLMPLVGVAKWETFDRIRQATIDAGWLHYVAPPQGKHRPGTYWTLVPSSAETADGSPCDESDAIEASYRRGFSDGFQAARNGQPYPILGDSRGDRSGDSRGDSRGYGMGELPNLSLSLNTSCPGQVPDASSSRKANREASPDDVALAEWFADRVASVQPTRREIQAARRNATVAKWANDLRLLRERDRRTSAEVRNLFERIQRDPFWRLNVLSPAKLREKWDDLALKLSPKGHCHAAPRPLSAPRPIARPGEVPIR